MKVFIGADHNGFEDKKLISDYLKSQGFDVVDDGDLQLDPQDDFPDYASKVAHEVLKDNYTRGVLICGSGQGVCMAANRFKGIRASLCWNEKEAYSSRNDDDANVLCLSATNQTIDDMKRVIEVWFATPFNPEERFIRRIKELDKLG